MFVAGKKKDAGTGKKKVGCSKATRKTVVLMRVPAACLHKMLVCGLPIYFIMNGEDSGNRGSFFAAGLKVA